MPSRAVSALPFILALATAPAFAAPQDCAPIENDLDRLACYDREAGRTPAVATVPNASAWKVRLETSEMTDDTNVFLTVQSEEAVPCTWATEKVTLVVRCVENTTSVIFATACHMTSSDYNDYGDITYRLDDNPARTVGFTESTSNKALGLWRGASAIPFAKAMFGHDTLLARMTPFNENPFTARFDISGLETAIAPLREACNW